MLRAFASKRAETHPQQFSIFGFLFFSSAFYFYSALLFFFHSFLFHVFTIWRGTECDASELDQIGGSDASTSQCVTVSAHSSALESASKMRCLSCACVRVPRKNIILMIWIIYTWIQVNYNTYTQSQAAAVNDFSWFHANKNKSFPAALSLSRLSLVASLSDTPHHVGDASSVIIASVHLIVGFLHWTQRLFGAAIVEIGNWRAVPEHHHGNRSPKAWRHTHDAIMIIPPIN